MSFTSGLAAGRNARKDFEDRQENNADLLMTENSPYLDKLKITETGAEYAQIDETNFDKMMFGDVKEGEDKYKNLELVGDGTGFYKPKEHDLMVKTINSLSTAKSYTDVETGKKVEGKVVGVRINPDNGAIHYDIETERGILRPKTLGFSNDPKDVVMSSGTEDFRSLYNTALRQTEYNASSSKVRRQAQTLLAGQERYGDNVLNIDINNPPEGISDQEYIAAVDYQVSIGKIPPVQGANLIINVGSKVQDAIDAYNANAKLKTEQSAAQFDRQNQTLDRAAAEKIVNDGEFYNQSGDIQRQILAVVPGNYLGYKIGLNKEMQDQLRNSSGEQKIERNETMTRGPGTVPRARGPLKKSVDMRLTDPQPDTITQDGVEYQRTTPKPQVFEGTDLVFPADGTAEEISNFLTENQAELQNIGLKKEFLDEAQAVFNRYDISKPEDMRRIPNDPEISFGRKEAAVAYAVAAGDATNFRANFEFAYNLMNTDDPGTDVYDRLDKRRADELRQQEADNRRESLRQSLINANRTQSLEIFDSLNEKAESINYFKDFEDSGQKSMQSPLEGGEQLNAYKAFVNELIRKGGPNGTRVNSDFSNLDPSLAFLLTQETGDLMAAFAISEGFKEKGGVFGTGLWSGRENYKDMAGNIAAKIELQTKVVNGKEQVDKVVIRDPSNNQYVPVASGQQFYALFPDERSQDIALASFKLENRIRN